MGALPDLPLDERRTASSAARMILLALLEAIEANVDGTIGDLDVEHLHDLRVACRRSRSAISQLKGVLPRDEVARFTADLEWLGRVTGPLRDLDVFLLELPDYRATADETARAGLDRLEPLLEQRRSIAHRNVVEALASERFGRFISEWRSYLETPEGLSAGRSAEPVRSAANRRIAKARKRLLKRGRKIDRSSPARSFHRLRIDGKKLRYLLEFFRCLYPEREITTMVRELKGLQDILGGFNDLEVQQSLLDELASELSQEPGRVTGTPPSIDRLTGELERRQEELRGDFNGAFAAFSSASADDTYRRLFG
jgi:CHAD domain-containing protein